MSANGLNGGNAQTSGLSQLLGQVGGILGRLMQGGMPGMGGFPGGYPSSQTGCMSSYYYTSNASLVGVDPCAMYQPATCTDPTASNYGAQATCTYSNSTNTGTGTGTTNGCTLEQEVAGTCGTSGSTTATSTATPTLNANPASGAAPLQVSFTATGVTAGAFTIDPGDGSGPQNAAQGACTSSAPNTCVYTLTYTYQTIGTYTANLIDQNGVTDASVSVAVENAGGSTPSSGSNPNSLSDVFSTVGGLFNGQSSSTAQGQSGVTSTAFPGVLGNILLNSNGATIFAQTVNSANNSETSGFYGSDTLGSQPQGVVSQMCQGRPWASNFLANVIPPSFFDSLCQWGGFHVGAPQQPAAQPQVTLQQQTSSAPAIKTTTAATSTVPAVPAQAVIWAVPSSVPLGTRTSIFWNTQGVASCTETSPDGSFNENSTSGAAATVPLTEATTYTISCLDPNGNPITDYVTVTISS